MKTTLTINLGGMVFNIDNDAYQLLDQYLNEVGKHLLTEEKDEILRDIEARMAELFTFKLEGRESVNCEDVREIIEVLGRPEQYEEDNFEQEKTEQPRPNQSSRKKYRKLYRNPNDKVIGGVASGLGAYFDMDPVVIRILFVLFAFISFGWGLLVYLIMLIAMPLALTKAQQLEMNGVEPTLENINNFNSIHLEPKGNSNTLGKILKLCLIALGIIIGVCLILGVIGLCVAIMALRILYVPGSFGNGLHIALLATIAIHLLCPAIGIAVLCIRAFKNGERQHKWIGWTLLAVWLISFFGIIALGIETSKTSNHIGHELDILGVEIERHFDHDYDDTYTDCEVFSEEEIDEFLDDIDLESAQNIVIRDKNGTSIHINNGRFNKEKSDTLQKH